MSATRRTIRSKVSARYCRPGLAYVAEEALSTVVDSLISNNLLAAGVEQAVVIAAAQVRRRGPTPRAPGRSRARGRPPGIGHYASPLVWIAIELAIEQLAGEIVSGIITSLKKNL